MVITIINQHTNNFGDEAAGISLINNLFKKYKDIEINIIYNGDGTIHYHRKSLNHCVDCKLKYMGYLNLFIKMLFHKYKGNKTMQEYDNLIKKSDYVIVTPCGANIGIYKDWRFLVRILLAIFNGKKPIFHLNTIGPSGNWLFDKIATYALKNSYVYVREKKSQEYLKNMKINCKLGIDTAFLFEVSEKVDIDSNRLIFVPSDLSKHKNFKNIDVNNQLFEKIIPAIYEFALKRNMVIHILPHLNTDKELEMLKKIKNIFIEKYNYNNVIIDKVTTVFDYYKEIAMSQIVVGMRYHAIVLGAKANVPFLALAYENKMVEVSNYTEKSDFCLKLYDLNFDENEIIKKLDELYVNHEQYVNELREVNEKIKHLAEIPLEVIDNDSKKKLV